MAYHGAQELSSSRYITKSKSGLCWEKLIAWRKIQIHPKNSLVGGFNPLEKYQSIGRITPYIMEKMFETTSQNSWHILMDKGVTNRKLNPCTKKLKMRTDTGMDFFPPIRSGRLMDCRKFEPSPSDQGEFTHILKPAENGCIERTKGPIF